jgi:hypothetical protein
MNVRTPINLYDIKNRNKNQFSFLFASFTKKDWILELTNIDSNIYSLIKEEVEELFFNSGSYLKYLDFESCYKLSIEMTSMQVKKNIKKNKKCFFETENNDNLLIYKKIKERLVNNLKNLFDLNRKFNLINFEIWIINDIYENHEIDFVIRDLQKLAINAPEVIIDNLKILASNFELTIIEIEELCEKLDINFCDIFELDLSLQLKNLKKSVNNQLYLSFNEESEVA